MNKNIVYISLLISLLIVPVTLLPSLTMRENVAGEKENSVVVIQANVPMSGLNEEKWLKLRERHVELAEDAIRQLRATQEDKNQSLTVVFPESPMNFSYGEDAELRGYFGDFARKYNASLLFNSAEPNPNADNYFNSAIIINSQGAKIGQYDKIHLVPFGEFAPVPSPIKPLIPTLVGSFQPGENFNLFPIGDAKAGIIICYESHFPSLSREFAKRGADVMIEMTNDGYLGDTGVLRQHLAGAISAPSKPIAPSFAPRTSALRHISTNAAKCPTRRAFTPKRRAFGRFQKVTANRLFTSNTAIGSHGCV